jgi:cobalt-zinc-cadmium efflux system membrane fusion protein
LLPRIKAVWCRTHGVHYCPFERPEIAQLETPPTISQSDLDRARRALELKERPENSSKCKAHERRLQFASEEAMSKMGVEVSPVFTGPIEETVPASGEIVYEQPRVAPIAASVAGRVWHLTDKSRLGAEVQRGDVLALLDAAEVGKAKAEFLQAYAQTSLKNQALENLKKLDRDLREVNKDAGVPEVRLQEADFAVREARIRLLGAQQALVNLGLPIHLDSLAGTSPEELARRIHFFGIPEAIASRLDPKTTSANLIPILAPRQGVVTVSRVAVGEMVDPAKTMFVVADTSRMWLVLNVRLEDARYVRVRDPGKNLPGQTVRFQPDGARQEVRGELVWRSTEVDEKTRNVQVRAELPNPDGSLLAHTFGMGRIVIRTEKDAIVVPSEAVHWEGDCQIVFVRDKDFFKPGAAKVFHVRTVRQGVKTGPNTEIIAGLVPGEVIATKNSAALRAELLKNKLGEC